MKPSTLFVLFFLSLISCSSERKKQLINPHISLSSALETYFPIGIGLHGFDFTKDSGLFIAKHFSSISTANAFKFEAIHPHQNEYDFSEADSLVAFAQKHKMKVRGHTLVWGMRNPYWLLWDKKGEMVDHLLLEQRLKEHISKVVGRYQGKVYAWDVINEAVYDNNKEFLKYTSWYKIMGIDYIYKAFLFTHEADSAALLFYNDYDAEKPEKLKQILKLIGMMKANNIPIHGMGMQAHWTTTNPSLDDIESAINSYAAMGLQVQITELDIVDDSQDNMEVKQKRIAKRYGEVFELFKKHKSQITGVTFWKSSEKSNYLIPLFDSTHKPTAAFYTVVDFEK